MTGRVIAGVVRLLALGGLLAGSAQSAVAKAGPPPILPKTEKWFVNYDDDSCTLVSAFGNGNQRIIARLTWFEPGEVFQLMLAGKVLASSGTASSISIRFNTATGPQRKEASVGISGTLPMLVVSGIDLAGQTGAPELSKPPSEREAAVEWVDVQAGWRSWRLSLPMFGKAMETVHACQRNLVKGWGLDPDRQASLSKPATPINSPANWLGSSDYPTNALSQGHNGLVRFRLDVGETGAVIGCHVQMAMKPADFEKVTCDLVRRRAKLSPALDKDGKPVASYYVNVVRWVAG